MMNRKVMVISEERIITKTEYLAFPMAVKNSLER